MSTQDEAVVIDESAALSPQAEGSLALEPVYIIPESDGVVLHTRGLTLQLRGAGAALFHHLASHLDGSKTRAEILDAVDPGARDAAGSLIDRLIERRVVRVQPVDHLQGVPQAATAHYESIARHWGRGTPDWKSVRALRDSHVLVINGATTSAALVRGLIQSGVGRITLTGDQTVSAVDAQRSSWLHESAVGRPWTEVFAEKEPLTRLGVEIAWTPQPDGDDLAGWTSLLEGVDVAAVAIAGPSRFSPAVSILNEAALDTGTPWLTIATLDNDEITVGPFVTPRVTACHTCLHHRLKSNLRGVDSVRRVEEFVAGGGALVDFGYSAAAAEMAANVACREICNSLLPERMAHSMGKLIAIDFENLKIDMHAVLKLPRCPSCSPVRGQPRPRIWAV